MNIQIDRVLDGHDKRPRAQEWVGIIVHHTGIGGRKSISQNLWKRLHKNIAEYLAKKDNIYVSAHYQIGRFGEITQIIDPEKYVAYHAGKSSFWHPTKRQWLKRWNEFSIGIELLGDGNLHDYSDDQYEACAKLAAYLMKTYPTINPQCIVGHEVIAPGRKNDPGVKFHWQKLYKLIFYYFPREF